MSEDTIAAGNVANAANSADIAAGDDAAEVNRGIPGEDNQAAVENRAPNTETAPGEDAGADREAAAADQEEGSADDIPISDWSQVDLGLPDDAEVDANVLDSFGEEAIRLGLTPNQAKALAKWQLDAIAETRSRLMEEGLADLRSAWGRKAAANQRSVMTLIANVDRQMGNDSFSKALDASGATMRAAVCKGLLAIANMLSEDSMGQGGGAGFSQEPETALQGIENAFKEMRARR